MRTSRQCKSCLSNFNLDQFPLNGHEGNRRPTCKGCWSELTKNQNMLKRASMKPENYLSCDDCDRVFSTYAPGRPRVGGHRNLRTDCPYCQSEEIARF